MLRPLVLFSAAALFVIAPVCAASQNPVKPTCETHARAKKLYAMDCAMCHGDTGNGKTDMANDLKLVMVDYTDPTTLAGKKDQELFDTIRNGKGKMPAEEEGRAKNDDVWALILYLRNFSKGQPVPAASAPADSSKADAPQPTDAPK